MKLIVRSIFLFLLLVYFSSFTMHKFYVSVTQIDYSTEKKEVQITMRIFVDDMNTALEKKYHRKFYLTSSKTNEIDFAIMNTYLKEHFSLKINQKSKDFVFFDKEMEDDVLICYLKIKDISKINSIEVKNSLFLDVFPEQQNIIHTKINSTKKSALLSESNSVTLLNYR